MSIDLTNYEKQLEGTGYIDPRELQEQRAERLAEARRILDKADAEKRRRTPSEDRLHSEALTKADELRTAITRIDMHNDRERQAALRESGGNVTPGSGLRFRNTETGEEIRAIRHNESFRTAIGAREPSMSVGRLIRGVATGDWRHAEDERRTYGQAPSASGGYLLNAEMSSHIIDLARAQSVVSAAGSQTIAMNTEELKIARVETDPTADWWHEGQTMTESEGTFGLINLRARCLGIYCVASLELIRNAANAEALIESTIAKAIAAKLDESALNGEGANEEPLGLLYNDAIGTYAVGGGITYDKMLRATRLLWDGNVEPQSMIYDSNTRSAIALLKDGEGLYMTAPPEISKLRPHMTTQLGSTDSDHCAYIGDFSNCIFGIRSGLEIQVSGTSGDTFKKKQVAIRGLLWGDFYACRSGDIVRMTGISAST